MLRHVPARLSILLAFAGTVWPVAARSLGSPTPSKLHAPSKSPPPTLQPQSGLRFHTAPRPLVAGAVTHDWRTFLGPTHNAIAMETPLLQRFGKDGPTVVWEVTKGDGYASPAVVGPRVLLFHRIADSETIECLHAETGRRFWKFAYPTTYRDPYGWSGGPRCQPVSDGERVYTLGAEGKLHCLNLLTGQVIWKRDLFREFRVQPAFFGVGATPLIEGNLLIVNVGAESGPCVAAFHKRTGKLVWGAGEEWGPSYASPIPAEVFGRRRVFVFAGGESRPPTGGLLCIDPAGGKVLFRFPWRARSYESVNASSPLIVGSQVFLSECYGAGGVLLQLLPNGSYRKLWSTRSLGTHFMTAIHKDGYLYGIDGHGPQNAPLVCIELRTGREMWRHEPEWEETVRMSGGESRVRLSPGLASLLQVDGRCLMLSEHGHLVWLDLNPKEYRELDRTRLFLTRSETWSMPALSRGLLYVCQNSRGVDDTLPRLICYDLREKGPPGKRAGTTTRSTR